MWRTAEGTRTLKGAEARAFCFGAQSLLNRYESFGTGFASGVPVFDRFSYHSTT